MEKRIVFKNADGSIGVIIPAPKALEHMTIEEIATKDVPDGLEYRIIDVAEIPPSRNYRNAWEDNGTVYISLAKAKPLQRALMVQKALERTPMDEFGEQDLSVVKAEINSIDVSKAKNLNELYNMLPASIENRTSPRKYK